MRLLIPLGILGTQYLLPIITSILILLVIVYFSYRQTIAAYPNGGGSYTVATENLGEKAGLLAAAALMIDYILTAAVGISAGVTAMTSALPKVPAPHPGSVPVDSGHSGGRESARSKGYRHRLHRAHLSFYRHLADPDRGGRLTRPSQPAAIPIQWSPYRRRCRRPCSFWAYGC